MYGIIPTELFQLTALTILDLHNSSFSGPLSESGFAKLLNLRQFEVHGNDFTGTIPSMAIAKMTNLERLQLQENDLLTGSITDEICKLRGTTPNDLQILIVGCKVKCGVLIKDCCDDNPECERK